MPANIHFGDGRGYKVDTFERCSSIDICLQRCELDKMSCRTTYTRSDTNSPCLRVSISEVDSGAQRKEIRIKRIEAISKALDSFGRLKLRGK